MNLEVKIKLCREQWQQLNPLDKDKATAKHLIAAVECAEKLQKEVDRLEYRNRELAISSDHYEKALYAIKDAPGGGPGRRIASQALSHNTSMTGA